MTGSLGKLADLASRGEVVVLSGAGLSTESGIPDYRGPSGAARRFTPMTYQTFMGSVEARRRYWARSHVGWRSFARAEPNAGHRAVGRLQRDGLVTGIITQNVDGLHQAGGASEVVELHGNLARVVCVDCGDRSSRIELDRRLAEVNPAFEASSVTVNPDGDAAVDGAAVEAFHLVPCVVCQGVLKPDVVFFGESVPPQRVQDSYGKVEQAGLLLVLGSSLAVMSGRRFVLRAAKLGIPVAIVNQGATRGDHCADVIVDAPLGTILPELCTLIGSAS
ncbi:MAG TPA: NAD-dependent protein deacetylase [Candidatus Limnocylindrales bacterium]|nr:NAD-dependent protein deacetylase [Candidatus Limnocylindrales bacterium]